jgi:septal ring factor EnvC (AmiA/AmiB activator)
MDWKHECGTQIPRITVVAFLIIMAVCRIQGADTSIVRHYDKKIREKSSAMDSIKTELSRGRKKVLELDKKEGAVLEQLEVLEKNIETSHLYLRKILAQIDIVHNDIGTLKDSLKTLTGNLDVRQKKMERRLRDIYKTGRPNPFEIILTSGTVSDMVYRIKFVQQLNLYDRRLLQSIDSVRTLVEKHTEVLVKEQDELVSLKTNKEQETKTLAKEQERRKKTVAEVQAEKKAYLAMINELEQAQQELTVLVKQLERKKKAAKIEIEQGLKIAFEKRKGGLPWPVNGTVVRGYGKIVHPVYKTITMCNGLDIQAPKGETVVSVAPGQVDYIGWMRGYGKFVIVNHFGGYVTIYAHLDRIDVLQGQQVTYGETLGLVGETGSLNGVMLHFQVRHSSETLDPAAWLEKKER